jgi:hypothetical protein
MQQLEYKGHDVLPSLANDWKRLSGEHVVRLSIYKLTRKTTGHPGSPTSW